METQTDTRTWGDRREDRGMDTEMQTNSGAIPDIAGRGIWGLGGQEGYWGSWRGIVVGGGDLTLEGLADMLVRQVSLR